MEIIIHVESKKIDKNLQSAIDEYIKRTSPFCKVIIRTYKVLGKLSFKTNSKVYIILPGINSPTSTELAEIIKNHNLKGISCIEFVITNPELTSALRQSNNYANIDQFNLSSFSMSADLTITVLTEQIYRAYTILNNITYHK